MRPACRALLFLGAVSQLVLSGCFHSPGNPPAVDPPQLSSSKKSPSGKPPASTALQPVQSRPLRPTTPTKGPRFQRLAPNETGVNFQNDLDPDHPMKRLYHSGFLCGGVAIGDVDGDGRPDLCLASGPGTNRLYRQVDDFRFEDISQAAGLGTNDAWSTGVAMADIDGDNDLDLYICNYDSPNSLLINRGDGTFAEQAHQRGLDLKDACLMPTFSDYDGDGDLDVYVVTYRFYRKGGRPKTPPVTMRLGVPSLLPTYEKYYKLVENQGGHYEVEEASRRDYLLRNDGRGHFVDVTSEAGMTEPGHGLSATWWDYNNDRRPDLYVANDFNEPDHLYRNDGDGRFTDVLAEAIPHTSWFSMGADAADINNDGLLDLLVADMSATTHVKQKTSMGVMSADRLLEVAGPPPQTMRNALYVNTGGQRFLEAAYLAGLADTNWTWAVKLADLDNDGWVDALIANGMARDFSNSDVAFGPELLSGRTEWDLYEKQPPRREQNLAFRNTGDLQFVDVSKEWGLDHVGMSFGCAHADLDRDGDLDLVVTNLDEPVSIYRNQSSDGHRVLIRLVGTNSNQWGLGASLQIETSTGSQMRQLSPMTGFIASSEPIVHFGLGEAETIQQLTIRWPSGTQQVLTNLAADHFYTITEPSEETSPQETNSEGSSSASTEPVSSRMATESSKPLYRRSDVLAHAQHREHPFDDFQRQPLLPNKLSQLGPGIAWGDFDGDGDEDFFLGGAKGQAGQLYPNEDGHFGQRVPGPWESAADREDMGALFFDADSDGDLDLYVVAGGVECDPGDELLRDALYLNDGQGTFQPASAGMLPDVRQSGSVVVAADYDRDGDMDLFVGARVIPGQYPLSPESYLLENKNGRFSLANQEDAAGLRQTGLVTSALWSDVDGDGWLDLLVTHEWGPVKVFHNQEGRLVDQTEAAGLAKIKGWFNGIAGRDFDNDGDLDYVVTNFGLNTKYHASEKSPALLYYGDFDGTGKRRLIEAEFEDETLFPVRGRSCSTRAMPHLQEKFSTFKDFAIASLPEIYTPQCLQTAHRFECTTLESGLLMNDGSGQFIFQPLPRLAQISPSFGVVATEVNGDGHADIFLVQNFFTPQLETGQMDGGLGLLLTGDGKGGFTPVWPTQSGLVVWGDAKSLTVTDFNGDRRPDFVVGLNNAPVQAFEHQGASPHSSDAFLRVRLQGPAGNPTCIGSRVRLTLSDGSSQTAEVCAGGGYLSQSTPTLTFGLASGREAQELAVTWPDGSQSIHTIGKAQREVLIELSRSSR